MEILIRPAPVADLEVIRDIYNYYVSRSTCTFQVEPDTAAKRLAWFQDRSSAHPVVVAEAVLREAQPAIRFNLQMITRDPLRVPCLTEQY